MNHSNFSIKLIIDLTMEITRKYEITITYRVTKTAGFFMEEACTASISRNTFASIFLDQR